MWERRRSFAQLLIGREKRAGLAVRVSPQRPAFLAQRVDIDPKSFVLRAALTSTRVLPSLVGSAPAAAAAAPAVAAATADMAGKLHGTVTIRGITKPLTLDVTINGAMEHPMSGTPVIGVSANGFVNRSDFELDRFIPAVADRVDIAIEAEFQAGSSESSQAAAALASGAAADSD